MAKTKDTSKKMTMADLMSAYKKTKKGFERGETVEGTILSITPKTVTVDIGGKSEGLVTEKAYLIARDYIKTLNVGDKVSAEVLVTETPEGFVILSLLKSSNNYFWDKLTEIQKKDEILSVVGRSVNPAGLVVDVFGMTGFIPTSHISKKTTKNPANLVGKSVDTKIIELDKDNRRIILSEKFVSEKEEIENIKKAHEAIKQGDEYDGEVTSVSDFGCFVKIPVKVGKEEIEIEGLVHISEMSWDKVNKAQEFVKEGEKVKVKVLEAEGNKISFSMKQTEEDPWDNVEELISIDEKIAGSVSKITDFGVFVALKHGIEGLLHITKIPPGKKFERGQEVNVVVEEIDKENKKISLGLVLTAKPVGYK